MTRGFSKWARSIQDGDLHWNPTAKHWVAVTPQGEEKVEPGQHGFYCRKKGDL
jgi:hypothetical protein